MIYFMQQGDHGPVKIGFSQSVLGVERRRATFQASHAEDIRVLMIVEGSREIEQKLHRYFGHYRMRGEWFQPHPRVLDMASCTARARHVIEQIESQDRWYLWGLVIAPDLFTPGFDYLLGLERFAAERGVDLDEYAAELRAFHAEHRYDELAA